MNIVVYSETGSSELVNLIELDDETELREFNLDELENYKQYNPSVLILDMDLTKIREFCAVRKFECCVLIPAYDIPDSLTVRALSYDYIKTPANKTELNVRINALLKTYETKKNLVKSAICDELTGLYNRKYLHHRPMIKWSNLIGKQVQYDSICLNTEPKDNTLKIHFYAISGILLSTL